MKKSNKHRSSRTLNAQQLAAAGGGYFGCDMLGLGVGAATGVGLGASGWGSWAAGFGSGAVGYGTTQACNAAVDNWNADFGPSMDVPWDFGA